jgi:hypothetical protein
VVVERSLAPVVGPRMAVPRIGARIAALQAQAALCLA